MRSVETAIDDAPEIAVLARAKRNFLNNGPSDRMWADPAATEGSTMSESFFLSEEQRTDFVTRARVEIEIENGASPQGDAATSRVKEKT